VLLYQEQEMDYIYLEMLIVSKMQLKKSKNNNINNYQKMNKMQLFKNIFGQKYYKFLLKDKILMII
jgi:hypothetical protein